MKKTFNILIYTGLISISSCTSTKNLTYTETDGSSFQKAIKVSSISQEYKYVKKDCQNCQLLGQSLVFKNKKPYDILKLKQINGDTISYYFDISKFYGRKSFFPIRQW